jgi:beta-galactosidase
MKLGVCYYPEHWPGARWATDARLMREAGLSLVRLAEFAWQQMEPAEGQFDWAWLDRAIDTLAAENLQIILCTPTAAPPAWLCRAQPDILPVDDQGRRRHFGSRHHYCSNSRSYRRHTSRIVIALAQRYGRHPAIVGWQIDNEFGCHGNARCYCDECAAAFRAWLQAKYRSLDALNQAWGTQFWSQGYSDWSEIGLPYLIVALPNPSQVLDYYRFSSDSVVAYQQLQIDLLRTHSPDKPITTNLIGDLTDLDYHALARPLNFVAWDSYPTGYREMGAESFYAPGASRPPLAYDVGDPYVTGFCHDLTRGLKQSPFWIMEQQAGHVNWSRYNIGVRPGTVRLWTWHALAAGAEAVLYFRWRACQLAQEQYHSGLLHHDATPALGYRELLAMKADRPLMEQVALEPVKAEVALLADYNDLWALQLQPHHRDFTYWRHLFVFHRALQRLGIPVDVVSPEADLSRYQFVIAPTAHLVSEKLAAVLAQFARSGGAVLLGVRSGFKTPSNLVIDLPLPGLLRPLVGATVTDWQTLPPDVGFDLETSIPNLVGPASQWAEALTVEAGQGGEALARYTAGPFAAQPALVENQLGAGRVFYLGWYPTEAQALALVAHLTGQARVARLAENLPSGVIAARRGAYTLLLNFTEQTALVTVRGQSLSLPPRDVKVLR